MKLISVFALGAIIGIFAMRVVDHHIIMQAIQNEMQANGLEDECRQALEDRR